MKFLFFLSLLLKGALCYAQTNTVSIKLNTVYGALPIELGKKYPYKNDSVEITTLKFYISGIQFYQDDNLTDETEKKHHLVDIENPPSLFIYHPENKNKKFNRIHFRIGVDSITNVSGAMGGDLDPINGMYWTWQSGYINFKLEGSSKLCPSRKNQFTFHIGGYQYPNNSIQQVDLQINSKKEIVIDIDVLQLLNKIKLNELYEVMSPNEKAMEMAKKISTVFHISK